MGQAKQRGTQAERIAAAKTIKEQTVPYERNPIIPPTPPLSKFISDHDARRRAVKEAVAAKHRIRIALATEPYSPYNTLNS